MAEYRLTATDAVIRNKDEAFIPNDAQNADRIAYGAWRAAGGLPDPYVVSPEPQRVLAQDLMALFTTDDAARIQAAIAGNVELWLLWQSLTAQRDPMDVANARFRAGWTALVQVLGSGRMAAIASALGVTVRHASRL